MSTKEYNLVRQKTPIPTADLLILKKVKSKLEALLLVRKTGYEKGKWCLIGGEAMEKRNTFRNNKQAGQRIECKGKNPVPILTKLPLLDR